MDEDDAESPDTLICVGCRQPGERTDLERFVYNESVGVLYDMRGGAPGREMFVHPLPGCIRAAAWAGFARALGQKLSKVDADELLEDLREGLRRRFQELLGESRRLGELVSGRSAVVHAAKSGALELVLLANSAGESIRRRARQLDEETEATLIDQLPEDISAAVFGDKIVILGLPHGALAERVGRTAEKLMCMNQKEG